MKDNIVLKIGNIFFSINLVKQEDKSIVKFGINND